MFQLKKGYYGYLDRRKKRLLAEVLLILAGMIILLVMGILSTGSRKNLLTIAAVVSALPLANQLVVLIAVFRYHSRPKEEYELVKGIIKDGLLNTELIMTSKTDKNMEMNYVYIHDRGIFCFSFDKNLDPKKTEAYLLEYLKANDLETDVFVIRDWKNYLKRLESLPAQSRKDCDERLLRMEGVIRGLAI